MIFAHFLLNTLQLFLVLYINTTIEITRNNSQTFLHYTNRIIYYIQSKKHLFFGIVKFFSIIEITDFRKITELEEVSFE
ncbi:hypothetical protein CLU81_4135 [Flavobacterium sp. 9]|nr:hypothetical protein CLU81_4135 [Flavobacterium sp. 9]